MRQTALTLDDLIGMMGRSDNDCGFIMNEIGSIFEEGGNEAAKAEMFLRETLQGQDKAEIRAVAYCYLAASVNRSKNTIALLKRFRENPVNKEVMKSAELAFRRRC